MGGCILVTNLVTDQVLLCIPSPHLPSGRFTERDNHPKHIALQGEFCYKAIALWQVLY